METYFNTDYPSISILRDKAKKRIPPFAFEYLDGGCNEDVNLHKNTSDIRQIEFVPKYIVPDQEVNLKTKLFGHEYDAPFGIAPIGLQGIMWPNATEILAEAAEMMNIPFILSTVATSSIEKVAEITKGKAWFQLYHPSKKELRDDLLKRAEAAGYEVLVILCDVPSFGYRPRDIRNGLSMPPKMTLRKVFQILGSPRWALNTLKHGRPSFETMKPYIPKGLDMSQLGKLMDETFSGSMNDDRLKELRDAWKGKLVLKGVASQEDAEKCVRYGLDGIIISNHGGRQLDAGSSAISSLKHIAPIYGNDITLMMDSGIRSGPDIACTLASGAKFTFLGRAFMYGVAALGNRGGIHTINLLKKQLQQIMEQLSCGSVDQLNDHLK